MLGKLVVMIVAIAFANSARAADPDTGKPTQSIAAPAAKPATTEAIKASGKQGKCKPHKASKADCFICDAKLRDKGRLWCKEHARYEDRCFLCHPEIKDAKRLYCAEHSLYEDECFLCHPELKKPKQAATPEKTGQGEKVP